MESSQLIKVFSLIEALADHADGRCLADLAAAVGLAKPTAHRLLKAMCGLGYVDRSEPGVYRLSQQFRRLAAGTREQDLLRVADPILRKLHAATEETVNLGVLRHGDVVYLRVLESPQALRRIVNPDMTDPFACTALGRAIVSQLPEERQAFLLQNTALPKRTPKTVVDPDALKEILAEANRLGYAVEEEETDLGVMCFGAAVFDADGVAGAISLTVPTARVGGSRRGKLIQAVRAAADELTAGLQARQEDTK